MQLIPLFKSLCLPSKVYLVFSAIGILLSLAFDVIPVVVHIIHIVYIVFWTWVLNLICRAGYKWISWVLVMAPFIAVFLLVGLVGTSAANEKYSGCFAGGMRSNSGELCSQEFEVAYDLY